MNGSQNRDERPASRHRRVELMGLLLDCLRESEAVAAIIEAASKGQGGSVVTPNLDQLRQVCSAPSLRGIFDRASLVLVDGTTLRWASWLQGTPVPERVTGSSLVFSLTEAAATAGLSIFLLGGGAGVADMAARQLRARFPKVKIAGTLCPPFGFESDSAQRHAIERALLDAAPELVYVCLGFPKQERLIEQLRPVFPRTWFLGLGVSLSFAAGELRRAPRWLQRIGLEWFHRMLQEPRLFRRFVMLGIPFSFELFACAALARYRKRKGEGQE